MNKLCKSTIERIELELRPRCPCT